MRKIQEQRIQINEIFTKEDCDTLIEILDISKYASIIGKNKQYKEKTEKVRKKILENSYAVNVVGNEYTIKLK